MDLVIKVTPELEELERIIDEGMTTFLEVGKALHTIWNNKLFLQRNASFAGYVKQRFGISIGVVERYMYAAEVAGTLPDNEKANLTEKGIKHLGRLPEAVRGEVWQELQERGTTSDTAIRLAVEQRMKGEAPTPISPDIIAIQSAEEERLRAWRKARAMAEAIQRLDPYDLGALPDLDKDVIKASLMGLVGWLQAFLDGEGQLA